MTTIRTRSHNVTTKETLKSQNKQKRNCQSTLSLPLSVGVWVSGSWSRCQVLKYESVADQLCVKECAGNSQQHITKCPSLHYTEQCWPIYYYILYMYLHCSCVSAFWEGGDDKSGHTHSTERPNYFKTGTVTTAACDGNQAYSAMYTHWQHSLTITHLT